MFKNVKGALLNKFHCRLLLDSNLAFGRYSNEALKWPANKLISIFPFDLKNEKMLTKDFNSKLNRSTQKKRKKEFDFEIPSSDFEAESKSESEEAEVESKCSNQI